MKSHELIVGETPYEQVRVSERWIVKCVVVGDGGEGGVEFRKTGSERVCRGTPMSIIGLGGGGASSPRPREAKPRATLL